MVRAGSLLLPTRRVAAQAAELVRRHGITRVIFGAAAPLGLLAPALRAAGARRIVGLTHGHETWWAALPGARSLLRRIGDGCDHLTVISAFTERRISTALSPAARARLLRLPPLVDTEVFRPGRPPDRDRPRRDRRRRPVRRPEGLRHPAAGLAAGGRPVAGLGSGPELVLVGDGPQRPRLQRLVAGSGSAAASG